MTEKRKLKDWSNEGRDDLEVIIARQTESANAQAHSTVGGEGSDWRPQSSESRIRRSIRR